MDQTIKSEYKPEFDIYSLSNYLQKDEEVIIALSIGRYDDGYPILATVNTRFNGKELIVEGCKHANWLVGKPFVKVGRLLRFFVDELYKKQIIANQLYIRHPYKYAKVKRDGKHISLQKLIGNKST